MSNTTNTTKSENLIQGNNLTKEQQAFIDDITKTTYNQYWDYDDNISPIMYQKMLNTQENFDYEEIFKCIYGISVCFKFQPDYQYCGW